MSNPGSPTLTTTDTTISQPALAFELKGVTKQFNRQSPILNDFNLGVQHGEFVSVVGESGCGKTTLLRLVAGLEQPTQGRVWIEGQPVTGPNPLVGVVFQKPVLLKWRTALENVLLPAQVNKSHKHELEQLRQQAVTLLERVGLAQALHKFPHQLSGGMQSRVALARALLLQPPILLCDEPFAALDAITRERLAGSLLDLWLAREGKLTVLFVTHDINEAVFLSDRVIVMGTGPNRSITEFKVTLPQPRLPQTRYEPAYIELCKKVRTALENEEIAEQSKTMPGLGTERIAKNG